MFMPSMRSATAPPTQRLLCGYRHSRRSPAMPLFDRRCENRESGRGTELAFTCALVAGTISVPYSPQSQRGAGVEQIFAPGQVRISAKVARSAGFCSVIASNSLMGYARPGAPDRACVNAEYESGFSRNHSSVPVVAALQKPRTPAPCSPGRVLFCAIAPSN